MSDRTAFRCKPAAVEGLGSNDQVVIFLRGTLEALVDRFLGDAADDSGRHEDDNGDDDEY
jgi:hypothetical protein